MDSTYALQHAALALALSLSPLASGPAALSAPRSFWPRTLLATSGLPPLGRFTPWRGAFSLRRSSRPLTFAPRSSPVAAPAAPFPSTHFGLPVPAYASLTSVFRRLAVSP